MMKNPNTASRSNTLILIDEFTNNLQHSLHSAWNSIGKLRLIMAILVAVCAILVTTNLHGRTVISRLMLLEIENKAKDATIEKLRSENKVLQEKLTFQLKVNDLVAKIKKEVPWLDHKIIRIAAEKALSHTSDPALYLAIGLVEAELQANVVHTDGVALGMHGLCPKDWHDFLKKKGIMSNRDDYFDPVKSFKGSEAVLSALVRELGSLEKALLYYNGGLPATAGRIPSSIAYVTRVLYLRSVFAV